MILPRARRWIGAIAASVLLVACGGARPDPSQPLIPPLACNLQIEQIKPTDLGQELVTLDQITIPLDEHQKSRRRAEVEWRDVQFSAQVIPQDNSRGDGSYGAQLLMSISIPPPPTAPVTAPSLLEVSDTYTLRTGQAFENHWYDEFTGRHRVDYPTLPGTKLAYWCMVVEAEQGTKQPER